MDPDAALAELRELAKQHQDELADESRNQHADTGRMADLVLALDDWLVRGGATPRAWARLYLGLSGQLDPPAEAPRVPFIPTSSGYNDSADHPEIPLIAPTWPRCQCSVQGGSAYASGCPVHDPSSHQPGCTEHAWGTACSTGGDSHG